MDNRYFDYPNNTSPRALDEGAAELGLLAESGEADWSLLFDYGERRIVQPGQVIIERGTVGRSLVIILSGSFRVVAPAARGRREVVVRELDAGDIVGEVGFAAGGPRSHTITADGFSEIFELEWDAFERLAAAHPMLGIRFLSDVLRIVAARTRVSER